MYVASQLPEDWVPTGEAVWVLVSADRATTWEAVIPAFSIAGMGETAEEAAANAFELLDDYLLLCAREGKTFAESYRPMWHFDQVAGLVKAMAGQAIGPRILRRLGRVPRPPRRQYLREPLVRPVGNLLA